MSAQSNAEGENIFSITYPNPFSQKVCEKIEVKSRCLAL